ncbi:AI-2E family transporter [Vibrio sp. HN007]|uniref:AI-2E family transporter n=1 Tax=Vibrio iocasae TaxID=3098914 RepID=UPI0035D4811E
MKVAQNFSNQAVDAAIKIVGVMILLYLCFSILQPFILLIAWGGIIATAIYPLTTMLSEKLGISLNKSSILITFIGVILLFTPLVLLSMGVYSTTTETVSGLQDGSLRIPVPKESLKEIPIAGDKLYSVAHYASVNLEGALKKYSEEVKEGVATITSMMGSLAGGLLQFIAATIISGVFMANADNCRKAFVILADRLTESRGEELTELTKTTVRSVVQGVIGVAVIQSILASAGLVAVGVPAPALWAFGVLFLAIVQIPPILILVAPIIYVFNAETTVTASLFAAWCVLVSVSDTFLKPVLLSRGSDVPMLVLLLGAMGGMAMSGIVGLFAGAVILSITYKLLLAWLEIE